MAWRLVKISGLNFSKVPVSKVCFSKMPLVWPGHNEESDMKRKTGTYRVCSTAGETFKAYIPEPLPPAPPLKLTGQHHDLLEKANRALGRLDGMTLLLPDTSLFLYFYVRKEALLSSQIE